MPNALKVLVVDIFVAKNHRFPNPSAACVQCCSDNNVCLFRLEVYLRVRQREGVCSDGFLSIRGFRGIKRLEMLEPKDHVSRRRARCIDFIKLRY